MSFNRLAFFENEISFLYENRKNNIVTCSDSFKCL